MGKRQAQAASATSGPPPAKRFTAYDVTRLLNNLTGFTTAAPEPQPQPVPEIQPLMAVPLVNPLAPPHTRWPQPQSTIAVVPKPERKPSKFELRLRALESQLQLILSEQKHVATTHNQDLANLRDSVDSILDTLASLQDRLDSMMVAAQPESPVSTHSANTGRPK